MLTCSKDLEEPHDYELSKKDEPAASTATTTVTSTVTSTAVSTAANSEDEMSNDKTGYYLNDTHPLKCSGDPNAGHVCYSNHGICLIAGLFFKILVSV